MLQLMQSEFVFVNQSINMEIQVVGVVPSILSEQDSELIKLLREWGVEAAFSQLKEASVGIDELKYLRENHINEIFPSFNCIGLKAKFTAKLKEWLVRSGNLIEKEITAADYISNLDISFLLDRNSASSTSTCSDENCFHFVVNIDAILNQTVQGASVLAYYQQRKVLNPQNQQALSNCIVDNLVGKYGKLGAADLKRIAEEIAKRFPGENVNTYYVPRDKRRSRPRGKLHDRYFNIRNRNSLKLLNKPLKENSTTQKPVDVDVDEVLCRKIQSWLSYNDSPVEEVRNKWKQTSRFRLNLIKASESTSIILSNWPLYKHAVLGQVLISIDFNAIGFEHDAILENWQEMRKKIIPYFGSAIKDKDSQELLKCLDLDITTDCKDYIVCLLLNAVLKPKVRATRGGGPSKKRRITIKEARDTFVLRVKQVNYLKEEIVKLNVRLCKEETCLQPLIVVVGESHLALTEFYVYFDDLILKLPTFVSSLDICFKIFHVFNVKYPQYCEGVWQFFQTNFFNVHESEENIPPDVCGLVSYLKNLE